MRRIMPHFRHNDYTRVHGSERTRAGARAVVCVVHPALYIGTSDIMVEAEECGEEGLEGSA